ncbi:hypothetical protein D3C76_1446500 [compost metagenome]
MAGVVQAHARGIDPLPAFVQPPANPLLKQYAATTQVRMLRQERQVVVIQPALLQQPETIADATPIELQHHGPYQAKGGEVGERFVHP